MRLLEVVANALFENRRRKGSKGLALLDSIVEDIFHFSATRICHDRSIAKCAWSELHPALEPADNQTRCEVLCRTFRDLVVCITFKRQVAFHQCCTNFFI